MKVYIKMGNIKMENYMMKMEILNLKVILLIMGNIKMEKEKNIMITEK